MHPIIAGQAVSLRAAQPTVGPTALYLDADRVGDAAEVLDVRAVEPIERRFNVRPDALAAFSLARRRAGMERQGPTPDPPRWRDRVLVPG